MIKPNTKFSRKTKTTVRVKPVRKLRNKTKKNHQQKMRGGNNNPINLRDENEQQYLEINNIGQFLKNQNKDIYLYPGGDPNRELNPLYTIPYEAGRTENYNPQTRILTITYPKNENQNKNAMTLRIKINGYEA
jgi:hypothetical protein